MFKNALCNVEPRENVHRAKYTLENNTLLKFQGTGWFSKHNVSCHRLDKWKHTSHFEIKQMKSRWKTPLEKYLANKYLLLLVSIFIARQKCLRSVNRNFINQCYVYENDYVYHQTQKFDIIPEISEINIKHSFFIIHRFYQKHKAIFSMKFTILSSSLMTCRRIRSVHEMAEVEISRTYLTLKKLYKFFPQGCFLQHT